MGTVGAGARADILLVGCGKMGGALLSGWLAGEVVGTVRVVEPEPRRVPRGAAVETVAAPQDLPSGWAPDAVVLAVKPQAMESVAPAYGHLAASGAVFLSVAAGRSLASLEKALGNGAAIARAMPNTPAAIGRGISVLCANGRTTGDQVRLCSTLMAAGGAVEWVEDEALLDVVTALSGSGPAYVFLLMEALAASGARAGLDPGMAGRLARETVIGSAALAEASDETPASLRRNVTSPGGTTEAALGVLMGEEGLEPLLDRALAAAASRARELSG